jgi:hypothetical protein
LKDISGTTALALTGCNSSAIKADDKETFLYLDGLETISEKVSQAIPNWQWDALSLCGLKSFNLREALALSRWQGRRLFLGGFKHLSGETSRAISCWEGHILCIEDLETLSRESAHALSGWKGSYLELDVSDIPVKAAEALSCWEGNTLIVKGLKSLSLGASIALIKWKNAELLFSPIDPNLDLTDRLNQAITVSRRDENGLFHSDDGPAIVLPDGYKVYAIHGVRVPRLVVENPDLIK